MKQKNGGKNMKKKMYFIIASILQIILAVYAIFMAGDIVQTQLDTIAETYAGYSADYQQRVVTMLENGGEKVVIVISAVTVIMNIIILKTVFNNEILKKKGKLIGLSGVCFFTDMTGTISIIAILNIIVLIFSKRKNPEDYPEKKEIPSVEYKKSTRKEIIFGIGVILVYFSQYLLGTIIPINTFTEAMIAQVTFNVIILILVILCFKDKLKRDLKLFKENAKAYIQYVLPKIGIMYVIYLFVSIICTLISGQGTSVNQATIETLPKWYIIPIAIIWAPIVEELIFRGILRRFVKNNFLFIILSAVIFGALHSIGEVTVANMIIMAIPYAVLGGTWAYIYAKTDNLTNNILAHAFQNTLGVLLSLLII